jgi:hypothetical protein
MSDQATRLTELTAFFNLRETAAAAAPVLASNARGADTSQRRAVNRGVVPLRRDMSWRATTGRAHGPRTRRAKAGTEPPAPSHEVLGAASGADWDEF